MSADELFAEIEKRGLRIGILYQGEDKLWRCTLVKEYPQAEGSTLKEVLQNSINQLNAPTVGS